MADKPDIYASPPVGPKLSSQGAALIGLSFVSLVYFSLVWLFWMVRIVKLSLVILFWIGSWFRLVCLGN